MTREKAIAAVRNAFVIRGSAGGATHTYEATPLEALIAWGAGHATAKNMLLDALAKECLLHDLTWADLKINGGAKVA